jgi:hypothetical protein
MQKAYENSKGLGKKSGIGFLLIPDFPTPIPIVTRGGEVLLGSF